MAYIGTPRWAKVAQRALLSSSYLAIAVIGLLAWCEPPWEVMPYVGTVLALSGIAGLAGALTGFYRIEWVVLPPMVASIIMATVVIAPTREIIVELLLLTLAATLSLRLLHLCLVASELRKVAATEGR